MVIYLLHRSKNEQKRQEFLFVLKLRENLKSKMAKLSEHRTCPERGHLTDDMIGGSEKPKIQLKFANKRSRYKDYRCN
jgi:hypothetical protein